MASDTVGHGVPRILQQLCSSPTGGEQIASVRHALQAEIVAASGPSVPPRNGAAGASRARGRRTQWRRVAARISSRLIVSAR